MVKQNVMYQINQNKHYLTRSNRSFYSNLSETKSVSQEIKSACKLAKRCYDKFEKSNFEDGIVLERFRTTGGGWKFWALKVRQALFQWFIYVRASRKARLSKSFLLLKAKPFYKYCLQQYQDTNGLKPGNFNMEHWTKN